MLWITQKSSKTLYTNYKRKCFEEVVILPTMTKTFPLSRTPRNPRKTISVTHLSHICFLFLTHAPAHMAVFIFTWTLRYMYVFDLCQFIFTCCWSSTNNNFMWIGIILLKFLVSEIDIINLSAYRWVILIKIYQWSIFNIKYNAW